MTEESYKTLKELDRLTSTVFRETASDISAMKNETSVINFENIFAMIKNKFGDDWKEIPSAIMILMWASEPFLLEHVIKAWEKYELPYRKQMIEYNEHKTINGKELPENFSMLAFDVFNPK